MELSQYIAFNVSLTDKHFHLTRPKLTKYLCDTNIRKSDLRKTFYTLWNSTYQDTRARITNASSEPRWTWPIIYLWHPPGLVFVIVWGKFFSVYYCLWSDQTLIICGADTHNFRPRNLGKVTKQSRDINPPRRAPVITASYQAAFLIVP